MIDVSAETWTGRCCLPVRLKEIELPRTDPALAGLYGLADRLAAAAGIAPVRLFLAANPSGVAGITAVGAADLVRRDRVFVAAPLLAGPPLALAAVLAHEIGHLAAGHHAPHLVLRLAFMVLRLGVLPALLMLPATWGIAWVMVLASAEIAVRELLNRYEREADELGARILGPWAFMNGTGPPRTWTWREAGWWSRTIVGYPTRRPWLVEIAERAGLERTPCPDRLGCRASWSRMPERDAERPSELFNQ